jgi:hypothetical protein
MDLNDLHENWINGNLKDVVEAIIANGKFSDAIEFALLLAKSGDHVPFLKMLRNRDK